MPSITLKHNMEIAHRLTKIPGKCQQIHGHSMIVRLTLYGSIINGVFEQIDFGDVKKCFRHYLDTTYDHHLLLNENDPWAVKLYRAGDWDESRRDEPVDWDNVESLPGLVTLPDDPTTENLATWIAEWAVKEFALDCDVTIDETGTNSVSVGATCQNVFDA